MKKLTLVFIIISSFGTAQNLVPNPSFEDTVYCPNGTTQIDAANGWMSFGNTPDYFNACAPSFLNVPNSQFGFQYARSGVGMIGLTTYRWPGSPDGPNLREFAGVNLQSPLTIGQKYYFSFFTNFAGGPSVAIASNKIGMRFSTISYSSSSIAPINNTAHLYCDSILIDSVSWYRISGSFVSDSAYTYLALGNFFQDTLTDTLHVGTAFPDYTYYYFDDVCVSTDSIYNETWTNIEEPHIKPLSPFVIFPNPSSSTINVKSIRSIEQLEIINLSGQIIKSINLFGLNYFEFSVLEIPNGIYYLKLVDEKITSNVLISIIH